MFRHWCCSTAVLIIALSAYAADSSVVRIELEPGQHRGDSLVLSGRDATHQLVVTGIDSNGKRTDVSHQVKITPTTDVVQLESGGYLRAHREGKGTLKLTLGKLETSVAVEVQHIENDLPVSFRQQIVPIFTKFGCNAGGCHGKADGQNGFKLSLFGFEPAEDYEYIVKEARGRRIFACAPEHSLLLAKADGTVPHGGGKKLPKDSPFHTVVKRWIEQGCPAGSAEDARVERIEVLPHERVLGLKDRQQLAVIAHLSDGRTVDVTRMSQFDANRTDLVGVSANGLVESAGLPGSTAIMARYQTHVAVCQATIPLGQAVEKLPPVANIIDEHVFAQLKAFGLPPSELCDDATFLRRATIDITGRLPTLEELDQFNNDKSADKRTKLVDRLLHSPAHADYFANKWSAILRNKRSSPNDPIQPTQAFYDWIRKAIADNKPYDTWVRELLTTTGEEVTHPPVVWYRETRDPTVMMEDTAQLFLGQRLGCAKCHHHPQEKWSQDDYYGFTAFFSRVVVQDAKKEKKGKKPEPATPANVKFQPGTAEFVNIRSGSKVKPTGLGQGEPMTIDKNTDPRGVLADWLTEPENPYFAPTIVNRYWKHFFGVGIVDPEDDLRVTNPPSNPKLLQALSHQLQQNKYNQRELIRLICTSSTYQLSAVPNQYNGDDRQNFSRYFPKRLPAEVLLDAINDVTGSETSFKGMPKGTRAVQLPDNMFDSYFLSVFGRPDASSACECERRTDTTLAQTLHLYNSAEMATKVAGPRVQAMAKDKRSHEEKLSEIYRRAVSRPPTDAELKILLAHIEKQDKPQTAYENILWALLNSKEMMFNH
ncbi:MAG: DUF1549 and DUF1553 domain-containing protein [Zavarzinella sp.]